MDAERQDSRDQPDFTFQGIKDEVRNKAKHPTISVTLIVFLILNIIMLIVGFMHMKDCPIRKMIPIYLIVAGAIGIVSKVLPFINRKLDMKAITIIIYALYIFEFIWMLLGSYWVYGIHKPNFDKRWSLYCDKTTYYLAFWLLTINWIFLLITVVLGCCAGVCLLCLNRSN